MLDSCDAAALKIRWGPAAEEEREAEMNIHGKALIIAAALGTVAQIILSLISSFVTPDPLQGLEGGGRLGSGLGGITWLICFLTIAVDVFVGVLYAFFHTREGPPLVGNGVAGGGVG